MAMQASGIRPATVRFYSLTTDKLPLRHPFSRSTSMRGAFVLTLTLGFALLQPASCFPTDRTANAATLEDLASIVGTDGLHVLQGTLTPRTTRIFKGVAIDANFATDTRTAVLGVPEDNNGSAGAVYVFVRTGSGGWTQQARLVADDGAAGDQFGYAVNLIGDRLIVGAPGRNAGEGGVYVFTRSTGTWSKQGSTLHPGGSEKGHFGASVTSNDLFLATGAPEYGGTGRAFVFKFNGSIWQLMNTLPVDLTGLDGAKIGISISMADDFLGVGAPGISYGRAFLFLKNPVTCPGGDLFTYCGDGIAYDSSAIPSNSPDNAFGAAIAAAGSIGSGRAYFAIGEANCDCDGDGKKEGAVYAYMYDAGSGFWKDAGALHGAGEDRFGTSLAWSSDSLTVGAPNYASGNGSVWKYWINTASKTVDYQTSMSPITTPENLGSQIAVTSNNELISLALGTDGAYTYEFPFGATSWDSGKTVAIDAPSINFGQSVAMGSDFAVAYSPKQGDGTVQLFGLDKPTSTWFWKYSFQLPPSRNLASLAAYGSTFAVGLPSFAISATSQGEVLIYNNAGAVIQTITDPGSSNIDQFGSSVAMSGDTLAIGSSAANGVKGFVYVYTRPTSSGNYSQQAILQASDGVPLDQLGLSVSIDGDTIVAGAPFKNTSAGAAYVFHRTGTTWSHVAKLVAPDSASYDRFGAAIAISGSKIITGVLGKSVGGHAGAGKAYVYGNAGGTWHYLQSLQDAAPGDGAHFGAAVSMRGAIAAVGISGQSRTVVYGAKNWTVLSDLSGFGSFGSAVDVSSDGSVLVGAPLEAGNGKAYVFASDLIYADGFDP